MTTITAKFRCMSITEIDGGKEVELSAVPSDDNMSISNSTPSGHIRIVTESGTPSENFFEIQTNYSLTFEQAN